MSDHILLYLFSTRHWLTMEPKTHSMFEIKVYFKITKINLKHLLPSQSHRDTCHCNVEAFRLPFHPMNSCAHFDLAGISKWKFHNKLSLEDVRPPLLVNIKGHNRLRVFNWSNTYQSIILHYFLSFSNRSSSNIVPIIFPSSRRYLRVYSNPRTTQDALTPHGSPPREHLLDLH